MNFKVGDLVIAEDTARINGEIGEVVESSALRTFWPVVVRFKTATLSYSESGHRVSDLDSTRRIVKATKLHRLLYGYNNET